MITTSHRRLLVPLLAALWPVFSGVRITVREAISNYGIGGELRARAARSVAGPIALPAPHGQPDHSQYVPPQRARRVDGDHSDHGGRRVHHGDEFGCVVHLHDQFSDRHVGPERAGQLPAARSHRRAHGADRRAAQRRSD